MRKNKKKQKNYWKIALISLLAIWFLMAFFSSDNSNEENYQNTNNIKETQVDKLERILQDYHATHTYSLVDLFVCTDTSIDVWNLVKTEGINAEICVGNVDEEFSGFEIIENMNHAWVLAETEPFTWLALETTGGYVVWGKNKSAGSSIENDLYYTNSFCFNNPSEFKEFINLRNDHFKICEEAQQLIDDWKENYVGEKWTADAYEFKGKMESKIKECDAINYQLAGLLK